MSEINIEWKVNNLEYVVADGGVVNVHWASMGSTEDNVSAFDGGKTQFEYDASSSDFVPLEDLTEEVVLGWVKDSLGEETIKVIEDSLTDKVNEQLNPTTKSGLPWVEEEAE